MIYEIVFMKILVKHFIRFLPCKGKYNEFLAKNLLALLSLILSKVDSLKACWVNKIEEVGFRYGNYLSDREDQLRSH